jgi:hypothetical protein
VVIDGRVMLPVQDCSRTYGGGIRALWFDELTPGRVRCSSGPALRIPAAFAPFNEGLHTLSAAGPVTLVDVKRTELSLQGAAIQAGYEFSKARRRIMRLH